MMRKLLTWIALALLFDGAAKFCEKQTDGFCLAAIHSNLKYNPAWETSSFSPELEGVLAQKFHYLGCGGQSFVFVSEDGNYVIKFFKHRKFFCKPYSYLFQLPLPGVLELCRLNKLHKALSKLNRDFSSYLLAYEELREETGLIYLHLNKTPLHRQIQIIDKIGIAHQIDLDKTEFLVQRRAKLLFPHIDELMQQGDIVGARQTLHAVVEALVGRCKKGIFDEDPRLSSNLGILGKRAIFIDIGRFVRDNTREQPCVYITDVKAITSKRLRPWLEQTHPTLVPNLDAEVENL
jgi:hypothetical protein